MNLIQLTKAQQVFQASLIFMGKAGSLHQREALVHSPYAYAFLELSGTPTLFSPTIVSIDTTVLLYG